MGNVWKLHEAKNKFSNLVNKVHQDGPQVVTKHGKESVVIIAFEDFQELNKPKSDLVSFFKKSPLFGINLDLERAKSFSRGIDL